MLTQNTTCNTPHTDGTATQALLLPRDLRGRWGTRCAQHGYVEAWPSRTVARIACGQPSDWCPACGQKERERALTRWRLTPKGRSLLEQLRAQDAQDAQDALEAAQAATAQGIDAGAALLACGVA